MEAGEDNGNYTTVKVCSIDGRLTGILMAYLQKKYTGITKQNKTNLLPSVVVALNGFFPALSGEMSLRIQSACGLLAILFGWILEMDRDDWLWIAAATGLVLITEMMNTAVERLTDLVSPGYDVNAGKVKDLAAGAVLVAAITSLVMGALVFVPYMEPVQSTAHN